MLVPTDYVLYSAYALACATLVEFYVLVSIRHQRKRFLTLAALQWMLFCVLLPQPARTMLFDRMGLLHVPQSAGAVLIPMVMTILVNGFILVVYPTPRGAYDAAFPLIVLYPVYGMLQQGLVHGFVTQPLYAWLTSELHLESLDARLLTACTVAVAFGLIHMGERNASWKLACGTTIMMYVCAWYYLLYHNVIWLGIAHGWIATVFYVWVLRRDMWHELYYPDRSIVVRLPLSK